MRLSVVREDERLYATTLLLVQEDVDEDDAMMGGGFENVRRCEEALLLHLIDFAGSVLARVSLCSVLPSVQLSSAIDFGLEPALRLVCLSGPLSLSVAPCCPPGRPPVRPPARLPRGWRQRQGIALDVTSSAFSCYLIPSDLFPCCGHSYFLCWDPRARPISSCASSNPELSTAYRH